jgi:hypothetical protein
LNLNFEADFLAFYLSVASSKEKKITNLSEQPFTNNFSNTQTAELGIIDSSGPDSVGGTISVDRTQHRLKPLTSRLGGAFSLSSI